MWSARQIGMVQATHEASGVSALSNRQLKVLVISTNSDEAGAPIHVETIVRSLSEKVEFAVVFGESGPVADRLRAAGIEVQVVPGIRSRLSPLEDARALRRLTRAARQIQPDLIHAHSAKAGMLGRLVAAKLAVPCLYTVHGWGWRGMSPSKAAVVWLIERLLTRAPRAYYSFVARSVEDDGRRLLRIRPDRSKVIYNGAPDLSVREAPHGVLRIVMPARVSDAKDHEAIIRAFERVNGDTELVLCGGGTCDAAFLEKARLWAPNSFDRIRFLGQRSDVAEILASSHIFALISRYEALPLSIIEAMRSSRAVVATNVGGVGELIQDEISGLLVPVGDVGAITRAFERLKDERLRSELSARARVRYEKEFRADVMSERTLTFYQEIAGCT